MLNKTEPNKIDPMYPYSIDEVADMLGIYRGTVKGWIQEGKLGCTRLGYKTVRILGSDLIALMTDPQYREEPTYIKQRRD